MARSKKLKEVQVLDPELLKLVKGVKAKYSREESHDEICPECAAELVNFHDVIDAVEGAIKSAPREKREALAKAIDRYTDIFMDDYAWALGPQSPSFLSNLLLAVECASRFESANQAREESYAN